MRVPYLISLMLMIIGLSACHTQQQVYRDYTAFKESNPKSILVLPPINESQDVNAVGGILSQAIMPLAEAGYYVVPVGVMRHTFRENGLESAEEIHQVDLKKLHDIFGADAVLYITVQEYGTSYRVISSNTTVSVQARLVDGRTGKELWHGSAYASNQEGKSNNQGLLGALISSAIEQISASINDASYDMAGIAAHRLLSARVHNGILYGPRSPYYWKKEPAQ